MEVGLVTFFSGLQNFSSPVRLNIHCPAFTASGNIHSPDDPSLPPSVSSVKSVSQSVSRRSDRLHHHHHHYSWTATPFRRRASSCLLRQRSPHPNTHQDASHPASYSSSADTGDNTTLGSTPRCRYSVTPSVCHHITTHHVYDLSFLFLSLLHSSHLVLVCPLLRTHLLSCPPPPPSQINIISSISSSIRRSRTKNPNPFALDVRAGQKPSLRTLLQLFVVTASTAHPPPLPISIYTILPEPDRKRLQLKLPSTKPTE